MKFFKFLILFASFIAEAILFIILSIAIDLRTNVKNDKIVEIPSGSATKIIAELSKKYQVFNRLDARILSFFGNAKEGEYELSDTNLTKMKFLQELTNAKPIMRDITLIPGETTVVFLHDLAKTRGLNFKILESEYNATAPFYEGFLVPDTYKFLKGESEEKIIKYLVEKSAKFHENLSRELIGDYNITAWQKILSKASIIQKEAANIAEMPIVSSVIENRLAKNMKLQMDGTLNYGFYSHVKVTPERIRNDLSDYNTYIHDGVPKNAVCVVHQEAIKAAVHPADTDFLYFMRNKKTGLHDFAKTYEEHVKNVNLQK